MDVNSRDPLQNIIPFRIKGVNVGRLTQDKIAIGLNAGETSQAASAVAIGNQAGNSSQAANAVAIGY